jgi:MASE11
MMKIKNITSNPNDSIEYVKKQLLFWILMLINILGIPASIIGAVEAVILEQYITAISYIIFFIPIFSVYLFRKKLSYYVIAKTVILFIYLLGVANIVIYGFSGAGIPIFLIMIFITAIFLDTKAGIITALTSIISMLIVGYLYVQNILSLHISLNEISTYPISWFTASAVLTLLGSLIIISLKIIQKKLLLSVQSSKQQADELSKLNIQLNQDIIKRRCSEDKLKLLQSELEQKIKERTKELQDRVNDLELFSDASVDRELRIADLRIENKKMKKQLEAK